MLEGSARTKLNYLFLSVLAVGCGLYLSYIFKETSQPSTTVDSRPAAENPALVITPRLVEPKVSTKIAIPLHKEIQAGPLRLTLEGVFLSSQPEKATAMIRNSDGLGKLYHIGEVLAQQVTLYEINRDNVVVLQQGKAIRLALNRNRSSSAGSHAAVLPEAYRDYPAQPTTEYSNSTSRYNETRTTDKREVMRRLQVLRKQNVTTP